MLRKSTVTSNSNCPLVICRARRNCDRPTGALPFGAICPGPNSGGLSSPKFGPKSPLALLEPLKIILILSKRNYHCFKIKHLNFVSLKCLLGV